MLTKIKDQFSTFSQSVYDAFDFNQATLSGCIDIIVVQQEDGQLKSSPFHVRFGKFKVLKYKDATVSIKINGQEQNDVKMRLGSAGEGYFQVKKYQKMTKSKFEYKGSEQGGAQLQVQALSNQNIMLSSDQQSSEDNQSDQDINSDGGRAIENQLIDLKQTETVSPNNRKRGKSEDILDFNKLNDEEKKKSHIWLFGKLPIKFLKNQEIQDIENQVSKELLGADYQELLKQFPSDNTLTNENPVITNGKEWKEDVQKERLNLSQDTIPNKNNQELMMMNKNNKTGILKQIFGLFKSGKKQSTEMIILDKDDKILLEGIGNRQSIVQEDPNIQIQIEQLRTVDQIKQDQLDSTSTKIFYEKGKLKEVPPTQLLEQNNQKFDIIQKQQKETIIDGGAILSLQQQEIQANQQDNIFQETGKLFQQQQQQQIEGNFLGDSTFELSMCGDQINENENQDEESLYKIFEKNKITFEEFSKNPFSILEDPRLLIKINDNLYDWKVAAPQIVAQLIFGQKLQIDNLIDQLNSLESNDKSRPLTKQDKQSLSWIRGLFGFGQQRKSQQNVENSEKKGDNKNEKKGQPKIEKQQEQKSETKLDPKSNQKQQDLKLKVDHQTNELKQVEIPPSHQQNNKQAGNLKVPQNQAPLISTTKSPQQFHSPISNKTPFKQNNNNLDLIDDKFQLNNTFDEDLEVKSSQSRKKIYKLVKTLKPDSPMLKSFNLKEGRNVIEFSVSTSLQGQKTIQGNIYYWPSNTKIVISDIDGTITKSDVIGNIAPFCYKDWTHEGVVKLFQKIKQNGYQILYLTARAIGQSEITRQFLNNVIQQDCGLPEGPVIMSPDRLIESFTREVIDRKPEIFKILCLREIVSLFPKQNISPFYAGFGNRETDAFAYKYVGMNMGKVFLINPNGVVHQLNNTYKKSYIKICEMVDEIFPPLKQEKNEFAVNEEFNQINYWSNPIINQKDDIFDEVLD